MIVRGQQSNKFGKFTKAQVVQLGLPVFTESDWFMTATKLREKGVKLTQNDIDSYVIGFVNPKGNRGFTPVFDPSIMHEKGIDLE